ncbi:MAG: phosphate/phosphite/phosphonate ABC transporter substrate-binding protein [Haliea sp.]
MASKQWTLLCSLLLLLAGHSARAEETVYRVGIVPQLEARKLHAIWQPILDELTVATGHAFTIVGERDIPAFEKAFAAGDYDFVYLNPWHAVIAWELQGYTPIVKDASRELKGVLVVPENSAINEIRDLEGAEIAFPAPNAFGASLLMRADLKFLHGIDITPVYVDTHTSVYLNVVLGTTAAGGGILSTLNEQAPIVREQLRILYSTRASSPHPISAHPRVDPAVVARVTDALLAMAGDAESQALLERIPINGIGRATLAEYLVLRDWGLRDFYAGK